MQRRHQVTVKEQTYTVSPEDPIPLGDRWWAMVQVQMVDEVTNEPVQTEARISSSNPRLSSRRSSNGLAALVGIPTRVFPELNLSDEDVAYRLEASGYLAYEGIANIPQNSDFPRAFTPADGIEVQMHPTKTVLHGRIVRINSGLTSPAAAQVRIAGIIRHPVHVSMSIDPLPWAAPDLIAIRPPAYHRRVTTTALNQVRIRRINMLPAGLPVRLDRFAQAETNALRVSNIIGLAAGNIIALNPGEPDRAELHVIQGIDPGPLSSLPATLTLTYPLAYNQRSDTLVQRMAALPPGAAINVPDETISGDRCLLLTSVSTLTTARTVEISGGDQPPEYHFLDRYEAVTDGQGYYRLPPLSRVAHILLEADDGVPVPQVINPDYRLTEQTVDFVLP